MDADIHLLYESDFYQVKDFKCRCTECKTSEPEYNDSFCISFVRKGNFLFNVFRHSLDSYSGCVLVTKPGYERTVTHIHKVPDECTIFDFKKDFYLQLLDTYPDTRFLFDNDLHSTLVKINPETEYLHHHILKSIIDSGGSKLEIDCLVIHLIDTVFGKITDYRQDIDVHDRNKKNHLRTIEQAKEYITEHFQHDISLLDVARHCGVSPFHFSRIFKALTSWSPYQFLLRVRLKHAELLLTNTSLPVADIAFSSGFNNVEHFTGMFRQVFDLPPAMFRRESNTFSKNP